MTLITVALQGEPFGPVFLFQNYFPNNTLISSMADHSQEACQFAHADGVPEILSPQVRH
jgi:hypothetical protein